MTDTGHDMGQIAELERRITAALERIGKGVEGMVTAAVPDPEPLAAGLAPDVEAELGRLNDALDEERMANAQFAERLRVVKEKDARAIAALQADLAGLNARIDAQGLELQQNRQTVIQLREAVRALRDSAEAGLPDPGAINRAMQAELVALQRTRDADAAELDDILAALAPVLSPPVTEEPTHA